MQLQNNNIYKTTQINKYMILLQRIFLKKQGTNFNKYWQKQLQWVRYCSKLFKHCKMSTK